MRNFLFMMKWSFFLCFLEILIFFFLFVFFEFFILNKDFFVSVRSSFYGCFSRILYLQFFAEILFLLIFVKKNAILIYLSFIFQFVAWYSILNGGFVGFDKLFGFGFFGSTTPSFLIFMASSFFSVFLFAKITQADKKQCYGKALKSGTA